LCQESNGSGSFGFDFFKALTKVFGWVMVANLPTTKYGNVLLVVGKTTDWTNSKMTWTEALKTSEVVLSASAIVMQQPSLVNWPRWWRLTGLRFAIPLDRSCWRCSSQPMRKDDDDDDYNWKNVQSVKKNLCHSSTKFFFYNRWEKTVGKLANPSHLETAGKIEVVLATIALFPQLLVQQLPLM